MHHDPFKQIQIYMQLIVYFDLLLMIAPLASISFCYSSDNAVLQCKLKDSEFQC